MIVKYHPEGPRTPPTGVRAPHAGPPFRDKGQHVMYLWFQQLHDVAPSLRFTHGYGWRGWGRTRELPGPHEQERRRPAPDLAPADASLCVHIQSQGNIPEGRARGPSGVSVRPLALLVKPPGFRACFATNCVTLGG